MQSLSTQCLFTACHRGMVFHIQKRRWNFWRYSSLWWDIWYDCSGIIYKESSIPSKQSETIYKSNPQLEAVLAKVKTNDTATYGPDISLSKYYLFNQLTFLSFRFKIQFSRSRCFWGRFLCGDNRISGMRCLIYYRNIGKKLYNLVFGVELNWFQS